MPSSQPIHSAHPRPDIRLHYLRHASFILQFDNRVPILTDYGTSYAYGLDSPVYDVGDFKPAIVTYSHKDADHYRGQSFDGAQLEPTLFSHQS